MSSVAKQEKEIANSSEADESVENVTPQLEHLISMGYPVSEARAALKYADNNLNLAVQYLAEGGEGADDDEQVSNARLRRRALRCCKLLNESLMDNPAINDYTIAALMKDPQSAETLREMVKNHSGQLLASMLKSSYDEEH
ncbi:uncharacterized protein LOC6565024 [Drosophila grimshawi]|nr:uncharacterized protein LOC6565024 [Drosophila grimshawi]